MTNFLNILLIGSGGRENAIAHAISKSSRLGILYSASQNPGILKYAKSVQLNESNNQDIVAFCISNQIGLVVIGPEIPLVNGLADALNTANIPAFGPSAKAAQLEGSKYFTKALCDEAGIPTAAYGKFTSAAPALAYIAKHGAPIVVKADGLAAGKGVTVALTIEEANSAVEACFNGEFGSAGAEVVIEQFLEGEEASFFALCDGVNVVPFTSAQDHKRAFDGDLGPNTGGMGAYSPAPCLTPELTRETMERIILPTVAAMHKRGTPFVGVLYAGLMLTKTGVQLIEYNCRFGDPETQVMLPRLKTDFVELALATATGNLDIYPQHIKCVGTSNNEAPNVFGVNKSFSDSPQTFTSNIEWHEMSALCVVYAAKGYPSAVQKGSIIKNIEATETIPNSITYHAGTLMNSNDEFTANGGRVLCIVGSGQTLKAAHEAAYKSVKVIDWDTGFYRNDIGWRAL